MSERMNLRLASLRRRPCRAPRAGAAGDRAGDPEFGYDLDAYLGAAGNLMAGLPHYPPSTPSGGITLGPAGIYPYPPV